MENYIGIDLGTTNSAICTFDKDKETQQTRVWKSPEQNDVTPSAIYIDRRGNEYVGQRAYNAALRSPDNCATLFKRFMGTSTPIELSAVNHTFTPEECSAKILRTLFGYLPEEIRNSPETGTVITVPAAFDLGQKNATMAAAELAGIGKVELVQEPVAAVMSYMKATGGNNGIFLIYDLGGGTLDIAIVESIKKRVAILAHGGIQMCGGRDFDRKLVDNIVKPWLHENFDLPDDMANKKFKSLLPLATWAIEKAKIELSAKDEAMISLSEVEIRTNDLNGDEIYLEIPLHRHTYDELISDQINETIDAARETLSKTGYAPNDVQSIVWVGGPTHYKPLRDKVAFELGIKGDKLDVNPMTAVAEGASIFAESITEWINKDDMRAKDNDDTKVSTEELAFTFVTPNQGRTPDDTSKIIARVDGQIPTDYVFQVDGLEDGSTSGRLPLKHGQTVDVNLTKPGENTFEIVVYDATGNTIKQDKIVITKTVANIDEIPSSHPIFVEVVRKIGGSSVPGYLVREGDKLPKNGELILKAGELLEAGSRNSLNFKIWEGEIDDYISDNRPLGLFQIIGTDLTEGAIPANTDLKFSYEIRSGGYIKFEVEVGSQVIPKKFDGSYNYKEESTPSDAAQIADEGIQIRKRIDYILKSVKEQKLDLDEESKKKLNKACEKLESAIMLNPEESNTEMIQEAYQGILQVKQHFYQVRKDNRKEIQQSELNDAVKFFDLYSRRFARSSEATEFDKLAETAQRSIDNNVDDFNEHLNELWLRYYQILWRQSWFVVEQFKYYADSPHLFADQDRFEELVHIGNKLMEHPDIKHITDGIREATIKSEVVDQLRQIVFQIMDIPRISGVASHDEMRSLITNILAG
ncbi:MAG: Hsp70 family protein [Candidatus Poribacteria bacterium]|nr:Hsp70 family protein [Candidatus Poribacteria bacterium]